MREILRLVETGARGRTVDLDCGHTVTVRSTSPKRARCYLCLSTPEAP